MEPSSLSIDSTISICEHASRLCPWATRNATLLAIPLNAFALAPG